MSNKNTPESFVWEVGLRVDPGSARQLAVRLDAARQLYNACLGEALRRLARVRQSKTYQMARRLPAGDKARSRAFRKANKVHGFSEYALHAFATRTKNACWIGEHLDAHVPQSLATRVFRAVRAYAVGHRGRPRFKAHGRMKSVEGKTNAAGIRWREAAVHWKGLVLPARFDPRDPHGVQARALERPVKYVRLVRRRLRGQERWYAQLVLGGTPPRKTKNTLGTGAVALDVGPSSVAVVGEQDAFLVAFCPEIEPLWAKRRTLQRAQDRSRRATNPDHYRPDGTVKPGPKRWVRSKRYQTRQRELAELDWRLAATRERAQGELVNQVLAQGVHVKTEHLSYRAFQRQWGKSVGQRAPGLFVSKLRRKAASAGGGVEEFSTRTTKLSQSCHCGHQEKKTLSERWHDCSQCGALAQRDLYSAFLALHVSDHRLDTCQAAQAWPGAGPLLARAVSRCHQAAKGRVRLASFGLARRPSRSHAKGPSVPPKARDAVGSAASESPGEGADLGLRTPRL